MELFAADGHDAGGCERVTGKSGMRPPALARRRRCASATRAAWSARLTADTISSTPAGDRPRACTARDIRIRSRPDTSEREPSRHATLASARTHASTAACARQAAAASAGRARLPTSSTTTSATRRSPAAAARHAATAAAAAGHRARHRADPAHYPLVLAPGKDALPRGIEKLPLADVSACKSASRSWGTASLRVTAAAVPGSSESKRRVESR